MLTRRAANPAVSTPRARRNPTVRDFRDRIRPGSGLLTHRPYPMSRCRCAGYSAKSRQSVRPWQFAGLWVDVCKRRLLRLPREGVPACFGRSACSADGVRGCPRDPPSGCQRPRTYGGQRRRRECHSAAFAQVRGYVMGRGVAVCKTVGSAYVGSNPTPATTCENGRWLRKRGPAGRFLLVPPCVIVSRCRASRGNRYGHIADSVRAEGAVVEPLALPIRARFVPLPGHPDCSPDWCMPRIPGDRFLRRSVRDGRQAGLVRTRGRGGQPD